MSLVKGTSIGKEGEQLAEQFLISKGAQILERNWRWGRNEIDLIVRLDQILVFVEVKARRNSQFGYPESFVSKAKAGRIKQAATEFQFKVGHVGFIRFDIVALLGERGRYELVHFEDAF